MKLPDEQKSLFLRNMVDFINTHDFFWSQALRDELNIKVERVYRDPKEPIMLRNIKKLLDKGLLGVSDYKGTSRQFYKLGRDILLTDLK